MTRGLKYLVIKILFDIVLIFLKSLWLLPHTLPINSSIPQNSVRGPQLFSVFSFNCHLHTPTLRSKFQINRAPNSKEADFLTYLILEYLNDSPLPLSVQCTRKNLVFLIFFNDLKKTPEANTILSCENYINFKPQCP